MPIEDASPTAKFSVMIPKNFDANRGKEVKERLSQLAQDYAEQSILLSYALQSTETFEPSAILEVTLKRESGYLTEATREVNIIVRSILAHQATEPS